MQLRQAAETGDGAAAQIAEELAAVERDEQAERRCSSAIDLEVEAVGSAVRQSTAQREALRHAVNEADVALARGVSAFARANVRRRKQALRSGRCRDRIAALGRRHERIEAQLAQQQGLLAQLALERKQIDLAPVESSLQAQLAVARRQSRRWPRRAITRSHR